MVNVESTIGVSSRTARVASFIMLARVASLMLNGLALIVVARLLGPSVYGIYTLAIAAAGIFGAFGDFGISLAFSKFIAEYMAKKQHDKVQAVLSTGFFILIVGGGFFTILAIIFSGVASQYALHSIAYAWIIQLAALTIITTILYGSSNSALIGFGKGSYFATVVIIESIIQSGLSIAFAVSGFGATAPIYALIIAFTSGFIIALYIIMRKCGVELKFRLPSLSEIKKLLEFSIPLAVSNVLSAITSNLALVVLGIFSSAAVLGNVGITSKVGSVLDTLTGSIGLSLLPLFSSTLSTSKQNIERMYNYSIYLATIFVTPAVLFVAVLSTPISYTLFGGSYIYAPEYIAIMCLGALIGLAGSYTSTLLVGANKVKKVLKYNAIISVAQLLLIPVLIPLFNGLGFVFLIFLITPILTNILFIGKAQKLFNMKLDLSRLGRVIGSSAMSAVFLLPLVSIFNGNFIPLIIAALLEQLILYPPILGYTKAVEKNDVSTITKITKSIPIVNQTVSILLQYTSLFVR